MNNLPISKFNLISNSCSLVYHEQKKISSKDIIEKLSHIRLKALVYNFDSNSFNLNPHRLGTSSNPVALLGSRHFLPINSIRHLFDHSNSPSLSHYFHAEEVINNINFYLAYLNQDLSKKAALNCLKTYKKDYFSEEELEEICKKLNISSKILVRNCQLFIEIDTIKDLKILKTAQAFFQNLLMNRPHFCPRYQNIVYKGGFENIREILAIRKAAIEGYHDIIHFKKFFESQKLKLKWDSEDLIFPIESTFLDGYEHIPENTWLEWEKARQVYELEVFQNKKASNQTLLNKEEAEKKLLSLDIDPCSLLKLIFYETKINAYDFHIHQFMIEPSFNHTPRKVLSIDEGRWGCADTAYKFGDVIATTFGNSLITHPFCFQPIPKTLRCFLEERLKEMNRTEKEMMEKKLIHLKKEFEEMELEYQSILKTLSYLHHHFALSDEELLDLAQNHHFTFDSKSSCSDLKFAFESFLKERKNTLKAQAFAKQSSQAFKREIERERKMATYLISFPNATLYEAFEIGYPELKTLMKVLGRTTLEPGKSIAYHPFMGSLIPKNLSSIIHDAENKKLATPEEIEQMKQDLDKLNREHLVSTSSIALTSDSDAL